MAAPQKTRLVFMDEGNDCIEGAPIIRLDQTGDTVTAVEAAKYHGNYALVSDKTRGGLKKYAVVNLFAMFQSPGIQIVFLSTAWGDEAI